MTRRPKSGVVPTTGIVALEVRRGTLEKQGRSETADLEVRSPGTSNGIGAKSRLLPAAR